MAKYEGPCGHGPVEVTVTERESANVVIRVIQRDHTYYKYGEELFVPADTVIEVETDL